MRATYGCDARSMPGMRQPVMNCGANLATLDGWFARSVVASDQQQHSVAAPNGLLQRAVDRRPGSVEGQAMKVEDAVRIDRPAAQSLVPAAIERLIGDRDRPGLLPYETGPGSRSNRGSRRCRYGSWLWRGSLDGISRKRPDRRGDPCPQLGLLRA